jgi:hypothetical protein
MTAVALSNRRARREELKRTIAILAERVSSEGRHDIKDREDG